MSKYKYQKEFIFSQRKVDQVKRFLKDKPNTDLTQVVDDKNNTVMHQCAYQGSTILLKQYVNFMQIYWRNNPHNLIKQKQNQQATSYQINFRLKQWVNRTNNQGFTCLHYAAFKGEIQVLQYLDQLGADYNIKTKSGLGVLHLASQNDKVKTFIYYLGKIPMDQLDDRKSTPLHWAAFSGSQKVTEYLLAQRSQQLQKYIHNGDNRINQNKRQKKADWINAQDIQNQTALHLATINGNTKIVRRLLIAGANRHIKNNEHKQPVDIAKQNQFINIQGFLNDKFTWIDQIKFFLNIKTKYQPKSRSLKMPFTFLLLSSILIVSINLMINYHDDYKFLWYTQIGLFTVLVILYVTLITSGPKKIKGNYDKFLNLWLKKQSAPQQLGNDKTIISSSTSNFNSLNNETNSICLRCIQYKPRRSNHCDTCDTCIEQYDHHCPWINNCVGKHNIIRFNSFIILLFIVLNWILGIGIQFIFVLIKDNDDSLIFFQINQVVKNHVTIMYIFITITLLLYLIFFVPLFLLIVIHVCNLFLGKTTYERFSKANRSVLSKSEIQFMGHNSGIGSNKKDKFSCSNCFTMCFSQQEDRSPLLI